MESPNSYCESVKDLEQADVNRFYHDNQYGFPLDSDDELFGRLLLEINQAGLSWTTILNKQKSFKRAFSDYNIQKIANYSQDDVIRLLNDKTIIRNKLKINSVIYNARQTIKIQQEFGSFRVWLEQNQPKTLQEWVKLFKSTFKFTGGEITKEFLLSTGYLEGAHEKQCNMYDSVMTKDPSWKKHKQ